MCIPSPHGNLMVGNQLVYEANNMHHLNPRVFALAGLVFLIISHILMSLGHDFLIHQIPVDFTHWILLWAAVFLVSFNFVFPKNIFNTIASWLTLLGAIGHIGMCTLDFMLWSFGTDYVERNTAFEHLRNTPAIWLPFMVIGPSLLYAGLATHAWFFIRSHTWIALTVLMGSIGIGVGQFILPNRLIVVASCVIFALGLWLLMRVKSNKG